MQSNVLKYFGKNSYLQKLKNQFRCGFHLYTHSLLEFKMNCTLPVYFWRIQYEQPTEK